MADNVPAEGEPANAARRPNGSLAYPPVFEVRQVHRDKLLNDEEYSKLRDDLVAARERASARAKANPSSPAEKARDDSVAAHTATPVEQLTATAAN